MTDAAAPPAALIFDVDGTLAETEELHRRAFNEAFAECGLPWRWGKSHYRRLLKTTGGKERMAAYQRDFLGQAPDAERIAAVHRRKTDRYGALLAAGGLCLRPGVASLIADARARGLKIAVATATGRVNVARLASVCFGAPMDKVFDVVAAGDEVAAKKPAPDVYALALARLGLDPARCVALEDSRAGLLAAKAAGLRCVVSPTDYSYGESLDEADLVADSFVSLSRLSDLQRALAFAPRRLAVGGPASLASGAAA